MSIQYLADRPESPADPRTAVVYAQIRRELGFVSEPFRLQASSPPILAASWGSFREAVLVGLVPRRNKETVAVAISQLNSCSYCVDAHTCFLHAAGGQDATWALRGSGRETIGDPALRAVADWAAATRSPGDPRLAAPPFTSAEAPEMIATAACFHYINRLVTIFLDATPFPLRTRLLQSPLVLLTSRFFASRMREAPAPGESLAQLTAAELPADLAWARPRPGIAAPFASLTAAVETEARDVLGDGTADVLRTRIAAWCGEDPPLGNAWVDEVVTPLPERHRPAARLALLTALAPYRVSAVEIAAFRAAWTEDRALVAVTAWASFTAARRITSWLGFQSDSL